MSGKFQFSTLQATYGVNGDYSDNDSTFNGIGVGIYAGVGGDVEINLLDGNGSLLFTAVPQGTFMQVPLFDKILENGTASTDLTVMYMKPPYR